ncbi:cysteinyl leukotriene receptor 1 [Neosynchiropus ocellatus]
MERVVNLTDYSVENRTDCPSIDDFRNKVYSTSYTIITVLGLLGNGLALVVLLRTYRQNSPFHIYMLNLALSDLLCVCTLPMRVLYYVNQGHWLLGDFLCRVSSYALYVNLYCSIFFMASMSVTRFLAVSYPVKNLGIMTRRRAHQVCLAIWAVICLLSSPFLMAGQHFDPVTNKTKCFEPPRGQRLQKILTLNYVSLVIGFILPFVVILLCYSGIIRTLLTRKVASRSTADTKAIRMIVIVLLTFLISFMPYHVQRTLHLHFLSRSETSCSEQVAMHKSVVVTLSLAAANSCFDPLLYFFSGVGFRTRLSSVLRPEQSGDNRPCFRF